ncbi:testis-expressed protein 11 [Antechinus flavipes]|uniref:testis-expressed protein 11 n=1 Tax=Antechinus flavipes TaxID=38775 RepID=UPI002236B072|nr:testis-expressed protein 11 [Antechinus flavipes]
MKTGKGWVDVGQPALADGFLETSQRLLEKLYAELLEKCQDSQEEEAQRADVNTDLFKVLSYHAESAVAQGDFQRAVTCIERCKDMLMRLPQLAQAVLVLPVSCHGGNGMWGSSNHTAPGYLPILCYNFGVEAYYQKKIEECSYWLSQSYEIGKLDKNSTSGQEMQSRVLRLLANIYLDWDWEQCQDKALETINLANEACLHPVGIYLKIKILLRRGASDEEIQTAAMSLLDFEDPENFLDFFLSTTKLLLENDRDAVGFDFLKTVCNRLEWSAEVGKVFLLHIELLLQRKEDQLVKEKIENILAAHHAGKELPFKILNWLHNILWNQAAQNFEEENYMEALQWYDYSLSFYPSGQTDLDFAKLQRNRASCYIHLKQLDKAYEAVKEAEIYDAANIFTQFIIFKIAVSRGNTDEALAAVDALEQCVANSIAQEKEPNTEEISTTAFLSLAAQFALENGQQEVAIRALEYLAQYSEDLQQVLIAFKCLIRLVISQISHVVDLEENSYRNEEMSRLLFWVKTAYGKVASPVAKEKLTLEVWTNEVQWFRKIAWNLAMQCEKCLDIMRDFFLLSFELSQLCPSEKAVLVSQKTCLLMAAAADLELGRNATDASQKAEMLTHAIEHVHGCREIVNILKQIGDNAKDPTENLLLLYEIEAKAKLNDASLPSVLDSMWEMPHLETKILETIASVVMEPPAHYPEIAKKTLKKAISIYLQGTTINTMKYSKCLHSFINLSLPDEVLEPDMHILEEIWSFFEDALNVISRSKEYPQVEILWLMTKAWNTGIFQYGEGLYVIAEKWCGLGIRFLSHLGTLKKSYEGQMTDVYKEIVANIEREKCSPPNEE